MRVVTVLKKTLKFIFLQKKIIIPLIIIVVSYVILTSGAPNSGLIKTQNVELGKIKSSSVASGKITPSIEAVMKFPISGKIIYLPVEEGQKVSKGEIIASIDREKYEITARQAEQDFIAAKAASEKYYDNHNDTESFDEKVARTAIDATQNKAYDSLLAARRNLRDTSIYSPISGIVESVKVNYGEEVLASAEIARIVGEGDVVFTAEVDETEIRKISEGQPVEITLDADADNPVKTRIFSIGKTSITTSTGATAFEVKMTVPSGKRYLSGMNGEAEITIDEKDNVLKIPYDALLDDNYVYIKTNIGYEKRRIKTGVTSDTELEVVDGLKKDDVIVVSGFEELTKRALWQKVLNQ